MAGLSVFLVEDNQKIRDHLIPALADLGSASVIAIAQSEPEAIAWLAHHKGNGTWRWSTFSWRKVTGWASSNGPAEGSPVNESPS